MKRKLNLRKQKLLQDEFPIQPTQGTDLATIDKLMTNMREALANQQATPSAGIASRPVEVVPASFVKGLLAIATSAWRAKTKIVDPTTGEPHEGMTRVHKDIERIYRHLEEIGFKIKDHTRDAYDDGQPMKVITCQPRPGSTRKYVLETLLPTIYYNDQIIQHGEIEIAVPASPDHQHTA